MAALFILMGIEFTSMLSRLENWPPRTQFITACRELEMRFGVTIDVRDTALREKMITGIREKIAKLNEDANDREKSFNELLIFLHEQKSIQAATPSIWPVKGWVTSEFGVRESPFRTGVEFHKGLDISTRFGKEVVAPADGLVIVSAYYQQDGNFVKIDHGRGLATGCAHLSRMAVKQGMRVKRGDIIGYVGDTGRSTGSHLHYSVFVNNVPVNPRKYLKNIFG